MGIPNMSLPELRPVQTENPMDQYAKALQIRQMGQQNQQMALQTEQQRQALKDQQAMTQAMHDWDGKDINALVPLTVKYGASANAVMGLKSKVLEQQEKYSTIAKNDADTGEKNLQTMKAKNDMMVGALNTVMGVPDEQLVPALQSTAQDLVQRGLLDPQHAQQVSQMAGLPPDQIRKKLQLFEKGYRSDTQQIEDAAKQAVTAKDAAEAKLTQQKIDSGSGIPVDQRELNDWLKKNPGKGPSDYEIAMKKIVPAFNFSLNNGSGPGGNGQPSPLAAAVASGQMKIQDVLTNRTPPAIRQKFLAEVMQINPQFKSYDYDVAKGVEKSFTSGADEKNLNAINTARYHLKTFGEAAAALDNGDVQGLNKIAQAFGTQFGGDKASNFNVVKDALAGELGKAFAGANVAEGDRTRLLEQISKASSPSQLKGFAEMADKLLEGKQKQMQQTYEAGKKGQPNFGQNAGAGQATHRFNPATGKIEVIQP